MLRQHGWANIGRQVETDVTGVYRTAARQMYERLADPNDSSDDSGSPLASGHYAASMRIGLNAPDTSVARVDDAYAYPLPGRHQFNRWNLPRATIPGVPRSVVSRWLRPFRLGQTIYISNSSAYAIVIEDGRQGKQGSWQKPKGVFLTTLEKLFRQQGWY